MNRLSLIILLALMPVMCIAQNTTRRHLKLNQPIETSHQVADTIKPEVGTISFFGFEKCQNSSTESFFITNNTNRTISLINITLDYKAIDGRPLHTRTESIKCRVAPAETKSLSIKSWDKQHVWHYKLTQGRHTDYSTPFDVKIHINYIVSTQ